MHRHVNRLAHGALAAWLLAAGIALAQDTYPSKPITMIVPFPPGGVADLTGRPTAIAMEKTLGQKIVVENKAGAGGGIGMAQVAKSKPDGYTIMMALSSISVIPEADKLLGRAPMYTLDQLSPIALVSADPTILVVRAESPWKTAKEFLDDAKKRPDAISYSSSGVYGTLHVAMAMLADAAGVTLHHVPYTGAGPAITALLGGHVDALATGPGTVIQHIKSGKLRALAVTTAKRLDVFPDAARIILGRDGVHEFEQALVSLFFHLVRQLAGQGGCRRITTGRISEDEGLMKAGLPA